MGYNTELIEQDLSFEEFEALAANVPKPQGESVYALVAMNYIDDDGRIVGSYPEFEIETVVKGYFSTRDSAETAMKELAAGATDTVIIYCFKIFELPLDRVTDIYSLDNPPSICEYLYDGSGQLLDYTTCSSLSEDFDNGCGTFLGKPESDIRVRERDLVEVICGDNTIRLAIVAHNPIDTRWCYALYHRVKSDTKHRVYMLDSSDDQVAVVDGPEFGNHTHIPLCCIMPVRIPVPDKLRRQYENYLISSKMANGQSGLKLRVAERDYTLPLERYKDRKSLITLRDAIVETRKAIEGPAAKVSEVLRDIEPKSHYITFTMPGIDREYDREFTIEPAQLRGAMLRKVLLGSRRGMSALGDPDTKNFNLRDELREGIAEIIHSDYPKLSTEDIKRKVEISYGEEELECYLQNLARFIRLVLNGQIPQRLVAKCFEQYFDVDLYEDGTDFDEWYDSNYNKLYD